MSTPRIQNHNQDTKVVQSRLLVSILVVLLLVSLLLWRLFYLQFVENERFTTLSLENRIAYVPLAPVRGQIYDREGVLLAQNLPVYAIEVHPDEVPDMEAMLNRVSRLVSLSPAEIGRFRDVLKARPGFETQVLKFGLTDEEVARFALNQHLIEGVELTARLRRSYPRGAQLAHVVGYVGRISEADLERIDDDAYRGTDNIGKLGIERSYEQALHGTVGYQKVEINAHGKTVRVLSSNKAEAGKDLYLSIDAGLQAAARKYLGDYRGAVVAVEPATGSILAFVSNPSYDSNLFVGGISSHNYQALRQDPGRPLLNRALNGLYAPGSTIKPVFGMAALKYGVDPDKTVYCPGYYQLPGHARRYHCWKGWGHGDMNLHDAIAQSCDVYFYTLAHQLGIEKLSAAMLWFGLGSKTGIDLIGEPTGLAPTPEWKEANRGQIWYPGETISVGIGQGYTLVTPLQLAMAVATIANRGARMQPEIVAYMRDASTNEIEYVQPRVLGNVNAPPEYWHRIVQAMHDVVQGERGTARASGRGAAYRYAGKTGTAQVISTPEGVDDDNLPMKFRTNALFIAFAPLDDPKIAVAVIAEHGGSGSHTAAPIARKVLDYYLVGPPPPSQSEQNGKTHEA